MFQVELWHDAVDDWHPVATYETRQEANRMLWYLCNHCPDIPKDEIRIMTLDSRGC